MSLLAAVVSKGSPLHSADFERYFTSFGFNGQRPYKAVAADFIQLAAAPKWRHKANCLETETLIVAIAGYFMDFEQRFDAIKKNVLPNNDCDIACNYVATEYLLTGTTQLRTLLGAYTIVIFDKSIRQLFLINDPNGSFPLYYHETDEYLFFCNEYEPIIQANPAKLKLDPQAVYEYLEGGMVLGNKTFFSKVHQFPAGSMMHAGPDLIPQLYNTVVPFYKDAQTNVEAFAREFVQDFQAGLTSRIDSLKSASTIFTLSGGMDTRLILANLSQEERQSQRFLTMLTPPLDRTTDSEFLISQQIATAFDLKLETRDFPYWKDDFAPSFFELMRKDQPEMIFSGHFGSEIFKAEFYYLVPTLLRNLLNRFTQKPIYSYDEKAGRPWYSFSKQDSSMCAASFSKRQLPIEEAIREELFKSNRANAALDLSISLLTRSFFTDFWKGTRGLFHFQPQLIHKHFCVPFTDERLINLFFQLSPDMLGLGHGRLYNTVVDRMPFEFKSIATNSNYANHEGASLKYFDAPKSPFQSRGPKYAAALKMIFAQNFEGKRHLYNYRRIKRLERQGTTEHPQLIRLIDFENWCEYAGVSEQLYFPL